MNDHFQLLLQETEENQQEEIDHILNQEELLKKHFNQDLLLDLDQFLWPLMLTIFNIMI